MDNEVAKRINVRTEETGLTPVIQIRGAKVRQLSQEIDGTLVISVVPE